MLKEETVKFSDDIGGRRYGGLKDNNDSGDVLLLIIHSPYDSFRLLLCIKVDPIVKTAYQIT